MGVLAYGVEDRRVEIDDVALAHLKIIIVAKLLHDDSVLLSVHPDRLDGPDHVLLHPTTPIRFTFDDPEPPPLDPAVIARLAVEMNDPEGLVVPDRLLPG